MNNSLSSIVKIVNKCCIILNCHSLVDNISVEWNTRFRTKMGGAFWSEKRIRLSTYLWEKATVSERYNAIVHEACHIIARELNNGLPIKSHGKEWKNCMIACGVAPERCHNVGDGKKKDMCVYCDCEGGVVKITKNRHTRMLKGSRYRCGKCHSILRLHR